MSGHLTDDELIDRLYGLDAAPAVREAHLVSCAACADKLRLFERRRAAALDQPLVSPAFLAAQRNQILERVEQRPAFRLPWVPAVLAGALVAAVVLVPQVVRSPASPQASESAVQQDVAEDQLFLEVFSQELAEEPRAASPIRGLFEAAVPGEQQ